MDIVINVITETRKMQHFIYKSCISKTNITGIPGKEQEVCNVKVIR